MAFIRTGMIIVALLLGWAAVRTQLAAHSMPAQTSLAHALVAHVAFTKTAS